MKQQFNRRDFLKLSGLAGVVFSTGLFNSRGLLAKPMAEEFYFVQFSDTHYGFDKKKINPDPVAGLRLAIETVNSLKQTPDFIIFTGDLTHTTDDKTIRRQRMREFHEIVSSLKVKNVKYIPGEHDASLDNGEAYREFFGETHYSFQHKGINFIALDNVSDPRGQVGAAQLQWLDAELAKLNPQQPLVVFAHRPLFALYPQWGWTTRDGEEVIKRLMPFQHARVFYGHIHQEHLHQTGHIMHQSARSLIFPLPAPGSQPDNKPLPWDARHPYRGLGVHNVEVSGEKVEVADIGLKL
jgi:hypothetical protein